MFVSLLPQMLAILVVSAGTWSAETKFRHELSNCLLASTTSSNHAVVDCNCTILLRRCLRFSFRLVHDFWLSSLDLVHTFLTLAEQLLGSIGMIQKHLNPALHVSTILLTMYDGRTRLAQQVADEVRTHFTDQVLNTVIPRSVRVSEAPSFGQTVIAYDGQSAGAVAYREAAVEIARRAARTEREQ